MKKILKKIRTICVVSVLSVSICFTSVGGSYYQAAALAPAIWTLIETLFLSLGVTFMISEAVDTDEIDDAIAADIRAYAEGIQSEQKKGALEQAADCISNIHNYWEPVTGLTIPQAVWEGLKYYAGERAAVRPAYHPSDASINLYGCSLNQYIDFMANYLGVSATNSKFIDFCNNTYNKFVSSDYSAFITITDTSTNSNGRYISCVGFYSANLTSGYCFRESSSSTPDEYTFSSLSRVYVLQYFTDNNEVYRANNSINAYTPSPTIGAPLLSQKCLVLGYGQIYDLYDLCSLPVNSSTGIDYGNYFYFKDLSIPQREIYTGVTSSVVTGVVDVPADDYDILTPGRDWDKEEEKVVGDVVIGIPTGNALDDYRNGLITWDELMQEIGAKPVDTSKGETLDGGAIQDSIIDSTGNIIDVLVKIPTLILDGLLGLFIPGDGFIEGKIAELQDKLKQLGIVPYDMSDIFDNGDDNPFKNITIEMYGQEVVIVSFDYLPAFLDKFRPAIRGLMVLFMLFYSINQLLALLRLSGMMEGGNINPLAGMGIPGSDVPKLTDKRG